MHPAHKQQSLLLLLFEVVIVVVVLVLSVINIYSHQQSLILNAKNSTTALASFAMADAERLVYGVSMMFPGINDVLESKKKNLKDFDQNISALLSSRKKDNPYLMDLLVVNEQGVITQCASTGTGEVPNILDREYITAHLNGLPTNEIFIGKPHISKVHKNQWFFAVSKPYYHEDGKLKRIIVAIFDIEFLYKHYLQLELPEHATVALTSSDGVIYTRVPSYQNLVGKHVPAIAEFGRSQQRIKVFLGRSPLDNKKRVVTFYKNARYPLTSIVSFSEQQVLKPWVLQSLITLSIAVLFLFALGVILNKIKGYQHYLYKEGVTEGLSGLYNRRYFYQHADLELKKALRYKSSISIIMIDIDDFKKINDSRGHLAGDLLIVAISRILKKSCRSSDIVARYGGEEFIILLPNSKISGAYKMAELLREAFQKEIIYFQGFSFTCTASFGVSTLIKDNSIEQLIDQADQALYQAKKRGKNRVVTFDLNKNTAD